MGILDKKLPVDRKRLDDMPDLPSKENAYNSIMNMLGMSGPRKTITEQDAENDQFNEALPSLASVGGVNNVGKKTLAQLLQDTPKSAFGRVLNPTPAIEEGFGKIIKKGMEEAAPKVEEVANDDLFTAMKKLLKAKKGEP